MDAPRRLEDCHTIEETLAYWRASYERIREGHDRAREEGVDLSRMTRPPRDPDERAYLEKHGGLGPFSEKPNPPWAKGWPPRNPNRPLTAREKFLDAVNDAWRNLPLDDEQTDPARSESDTAVPGSNTAPAGDDDRAPATPDDTTSSGTAATP